MKTYDLAGAMIYNMDPEFATSEKLKDLIIGHVIAMDGETDYGPEMVEALLRAYNHALLDEAHTADNEPETFVDCANAEVIFRESFIVGMRQVLGCTAEDAIEACLFPECLPYNDTFSYSSSLIKDIGFFLGYRNGHQCIAMRKYFESQNKAV